MKIDGSTAWRSITQPISDRSLSDALAGLRHVELAHEYLSAIPAERDGHQSHGIPAPAQDNHRASQPCLQASQRQVALRGEANLTSPSKRICPTPTWNGFRLARCFARGPLCNRHRLPPCPQAPQWHPRGATVSCVSDSSPFGLREIHLARAVIDYQVVSYPKGAR